MTKGKFLSTILLSLATYLLLAIMLVIASGANEYCTLDQAEKETISDVLDLEDESDSDSEDEKESEKEKEFEDKDFSIHKLKGSTISLLSRISVAPNGFWEMVKFDVFVPPPEDTMC